MNHAKTSSADKDFSQNGAGNNSVSTPVKQTKTHEQLMRRYQEHVDGKALIVFPIGKENNHFFYLSLIFYWFTLDMPQILVRILVFDVHLSNFWGV